MPNETSETPTTADKNNEVKVHVASGQRRLWPWVVFVLGTLLFNFSLDAISRGTTVSLHHFAFASVSGVITGELCLALIVCLWSRYWLAGYAGATVLVMADFLSAIFGRYYCLQWFDGIVLSVTREVVSPVFFIPPFILLSSIGLIAVRTLRGWRLTRGELTAQSSEFGITDLIIGTALVATLLMMARSAQALGSFPLTEYSLRIVFFSSILCVASVFAVIPTVWILFRAEQRRVLKLLVIVVVNCSVVMSLVGAFSELSGPTLPLQTVLVLTVLWVVIAFAYTIVGIILLRAAGFQLQTGRLLVAPASVPVESSLSRLSVPVGIVGGFMVIQLILSSVVAFRTGQVVLSRQLMRDMAAQGGRVEVDPEGNVISMALSPTATRGDFVKLRNYPNLKSVVLAGTAYNDSDLQLLKPLTQLESLDLSRTLITDAGLGELAGWSKLVVLSVAKTKCTAAGLHNFVERHPLYKLDIGYLNLDDAEVETIAKAITPQTPTVPNGSRGRVAETICLVLSGNPITNDGLFFLAGSQHLWSLDLTDCNVDEGCIWTNTLMDLNLDGTKIGLAFASRAKTLGVYGRLSMDRTEVNDNTLPSLIGGTVQHLKIGESQITEQGLSGLGLSGPIQLTLNSRKFTGQCFATCKPNLQTLDMSHSGVSDSEIEHIVTLPRIYNLSLSDTGVSDVCLETLAKSKLQFINLSGTRVTAAGLASKDWKNKAVSIAADQFTEAEIKMLLTKGSFRIVPPLEKQ